MDARNLEHQLAQAQQDLLTSIEAELAYGDKAREHRAEMVNPELTYQQREAQQRLHLQYAGQHVGQRRESDRLRFAVAKLQRAIQEERDMRILSDEVLLERLKAQQPVKLSAEQVAAMDETLEAAL